MNQIKLPKEDRSVTEVAETNYPEKTNQNQKIISLRKQPIAEKAIPDEVVSEMGRLSKKLKDQNHPLAELPLALAPHLGARGSKGWQKNFEEALTPLQNDSNIDVVGVLAHNTAFKEIDALIETARTLSHFVPLQFTLILTHWEDLANPVTDKVFKTIAEGIECQLRSRLESSKLIIVDRAAIGNSTAFVQACEEIWDRKEGTPCVEDYDWIVSFYGRQNSYRPQGMAQALHDFTMRRGIGLLIGDLNPNIALLTEMKERLSRCYRCPCPTLNVRP